MGAGSVGIVVVNGEKGVYLVYVVYLVDFRFGMSDEHILIVYSPLSFPSLP